MEVYTARGISTLPLLSPKSIQSHKTNLSLTPKFGLQYYGKSLSVSVKSTPTNETSTETTPYLEKSEPRFDSGFVISNDDDARKVEEEKDDFDGGLTNEVSEDGSDNFQILKFLEDLGVKVDYEDTSSVLVFGGGGAVALWLAAAVVGAIDSIPLVPKVLELVGLGYTVWFSSRYLLFKKTREELVTKIEEIKQQVVGVKED